MLDTRTGQTDLFHSFCGEKRNHEHFSWSFASNLLELSSSRWSWCREKSTDFWGVIALFQSFGSLQKKLRYSMRFILGMRVGQKSSILLLFELPAKMLRQRSTNMSWALLNWSWAPFQKNFKPSKSRFLANRTPQQKKTSFLSLKKHLKERNWRGKRVGHPPPNRENHHSKYQRIGNFPTLRSDIILILRGHARQIHHQLKAQLAKDVDTFLGEQKKPVFVGWFFLKKKHPQSGGVCVPFSKKKWRWRNTYI